MCYVAWGSSKPHSTYFFHGFGFFVFFDFLVLLDFRRGWLGWLAGLAGLARLSVEEEVCAMWLGMVQAT